MKIDTTPNLNWDKPVYVYAVFYENKYYDFKGAFLANTLDQVRKHLRNCATSFTAKRIWVYGDIRPSSQLLLGGI